MQQPKHVEDEPWKEGFNVGKKKVEGDVMPEVFESNQISFIFFYHLELSHFESEYVEAVIS